MTRFSAVETSKPLKLHPPLTVDHMKLGNYELADGLAEAFDVAMMLGVPLLLTGEPGTGKTQAGIWLAEELGVSPPLRYNVKSGSTGADLLYSFDEVARFRDGALKKPLVDYLRLNALGEAIVRAAGGRAVLRDMFGAPLEGEHFRECEDLMIRAFGELADGEAATASLLLPRVAGFAEAEPQHRVVLIDELDKAPRDTPNDLLFEVERMAFAIPELGVMVEADPDMRPIVVMTSNSEKELPAPFLRRCVFFDIPPPDRDALRRIVGNAIERLDRDGRLLKSALDLFIAIQNEAEIGKKPATAELLAWLDTLLRQAFENSDSLIEIFQQNPGRVERSLCAVVKSRDDIAAAKRAVRRAVDGSTATAGAGA